MSAEVEIDGLEALYSKWSGLVRDLDEAAKDASEEAAKQGAQHARTSHTFQNRTGKLEQSIKGEYVGTREPRAPASSLGAGILGASRPANNTSGSAQHWARIYTDVKYAKFVERGTRPHPIDPKRGKWLAWEPMQGDVHFAKHVDHPGTKPYPFMKLAAEKAAAVLYAVYDAHVERLCAAFNQQ